MQACYKPSLLLSLLITSVAFPAMSAIPPISPGPIVRPTTVSSPVTVPNHLRYEAPINLGSLSGPNATPYSSALSINNQEQIVGGTSTPPDAAGFSYTKSFLWQNNVMTLIPPPGPTDTYRVLWDINNSSIAVGGADQSVAYTYQNGTISLLPHLSVKNISQAYGISDTGKTVGYSVASNGKDHAVAWQNGTITDIGTLNGYPHTTANGISDSGAFIVGWAYGAPWRAVMWNQNNPPFLLDATNIDSSFALTVNNSGIAVGGASFTNDNSGTVPVRWINGQVSKLLQDPIPLGRATSINNKQQIVGMVWNPTAKAFLWDNGTGYYLNDLIPPNSGWFITQAHAINDRGEIVGSGIFNGQELGILLRPKQ